MSLKLHASIIVTYRCNARCNMCNAWKNPTKPEEEIGLDVIEKLPDLFFANITGGEPFVRRDVEDIVELLKKKSKRIVISTNGFFTDRIIALCKKYPEVGIRISMEGLCKTNDTIRGIPEGFDRIIKTLFDLRAIGIKDIGFGVTVQDLNYKDLIYLYYLSRALDYEFATATLHSSHYFHKTDNKLEKKKEIVAEFEKLIKLLLKSKRIKNWFRAYFNYGLINYINGGKRLLPCEMGKNGFFLDPYGDILACNGMNEKVSMGNLKNKSWEEIWYGKEADEVRKMVENCGKNCWMIGSAAPAIWYHPLNPILWVIKNKTRLFFKKDKKIN